MSEEIGPPQEMVDSGLSMTGDSQPSFEVSGDQLPGVELAEQPEGDEQVSAEGVSVSGDQPAVETEAVEQSIIDLKSETEGASGSAADGDAKDHRDRLTRQAAIEELRRGETYSTRYQQRDAAHSARAIKEAVRHARLGFEEVVRDVRGKGETRESRYNGSPEGLAHLLERLNDDYSLSSGQVFDTAYQEIVSPIRYGKPAEREAALAKLKEATDSVIEQLERHNRQYLLRYARIARQSAQERYDRDPERYAQMSAREFAETMPDYMDATAELELAEVGESYISEAITRLRAQSEQAKNPGTGEKRVRNFDLEKSASSALEAVIDRLNDLTGGTQALLESLEAVLYPGETDADERRSNQYGILQMMRGDSHVAYGCARKQLEDPTRPVVEQVDDFIALLERIHGEMYLPRLEARRRKVVDKWGPEPLKNDELEEKAA